MKKVLTPARGAIAAVIAVSMMLPANAQSQLRRGLETGEAATLRAEQTQNRINQLDDERTQLVSEFRTLLQRKQSAELFARQQERVVASQERELESLTEQLGRVDEITSQTVPMLNDLIDDLELFVKADLPFRRTQRLEAIENLRDIMDSADVAIVEKYRVIIEAYEREMEYGEKIDTWSEEIDIDGNPVQVQMFLYGRVALVYMSDDRRYAARFERDGQGGGQWVDVDNAFKADIAKAIKIAEGKKTQDVLYAPATKLTVQ